MAPSGGTRGEGLRFFGLWLKDPFRIGAVAPSSRALARAMVAPVDRANPGAVVELGGGTGAFTRQLLASGVPPEKLLVLEKTPELHAVLVEKFPQLRVVLGDAADIARHAQEAGLGPVKAVVSGLPLIGMPAEVQERIVGGTMATLEPGGIFVQFTYTPVSPVRPKVMAKLGVTGKRVAWALANLPPAAVWVYRRAGSGAG